ncbi:MAG: histidine phosphatase family protein [Hydrogenovibrio sp.]|uniref:histidine phosphatase family protein n=1 Tax=Hydrogenovibrio sp. TaxID=2065821 RepID=UPI00286FBFDF|nr:histidine phosphatase family protein [Hydrogenovibrio sp.]MDR9498456.1 histidine phosphatase family protein [Hydrogenovibrio sp.]
MNSLVMAFLRHSDYHQRPDTPSALQPWGLTDKGREQARAGAHNLMDWAKAQGFILDPAIVCSTSLRAWQTAQIIATELNQNKAPFPVTGRATDQVFHPVSLLPLHERSVGAAANLTLDEIEQALAADPRHAVPAPGWKSDSHYCLPFEGAESLIQAGHRVKTALETLCQPLAENIQANTLKVVIGHGASFRHAAYLMGVLRFDAIHQLSLYHARPLLFRYTPGQNPAWVQLSGQWKQRTASDHSPTPD